MTKRMRSNLMLLLTAFLWGSTFVAQKAGTAVGPLTYNGVRSVIGALVLVPVIVVLRKKKAAGGRQAAAAARGKLLLGGVLSAGVALRSRSASTGRSSPA